MLNPNELRAEKAKLLASAKKIQKECQNGEDVMTVEKKAEFDEIMSKAEALEALAQGVEAGERTEAEEAARAGNYQLAPAGESYGGLHERPEDGAAQILAGEGGSAPSALRSALAGGRGRRYRDMFPDVALSDGGFRTVEEFYRMYDSGMSDDRMMAAMTGGRTGESGALVPTQETARIFDESLENEIVRPRCRLEPMTSDTKKIGGFTVMADNAGEPFGFSAQWTGEAETKTRQKGRTRVIELRAKKLMLLADASNELVDDGTGFESQLGVAMVGALGWGLDYACLNGTGAGEPRGVLNDSALITVPKEAGQAATSIVYENLCQIYARMHPACRPRSVWVCNNTAIPSLLSLAIAVGTGGAHIPVLKEDGRGGFTILTRPVLFTEKVPALGTAGDIGLFDFSQYALGLRRELILERNVAPGWTGDTVDYRGKIRADGQGLWDKVVTPKNGDTLSWAVVVADR